MRQQDMWFGSTDAELYIRNLSWEDAGVYICHFAGSNEKTLWLSIKGTLFFGWFYISFMVQILDANDVVTRDCFYLDCGGLPFPSTGFPARDVSVSLGFRVRVVLWC